MWPRPSGDGVTAFLMRRQQKRSAPEAKDARAGKDGPRTRSMRAERHRQRGRLLFHEQMHQTRKHSERREGQKR